MIPMAKYNVRPVLAMEWSLFCFKLSVCKLFQCGLICWSRVPDFTKPSPKSMLTCRLDRSEHFNKISIKITTKWAKEVPVIILVTVYLGLNMLILIKSMGSCKKDVTPLLTHWSYVFLSLTHPFVLCLRYCSAYPRLFPVKSQITGSMPIQDQGGNTNPTPIFTKTYLMIKSHNVLKYWDWVLKSLYHSKISQVPRQHCCRGACQISEWSDNSKPIFYSWEMLPGLVIWFLLSE